MVILGCRSVDGDPHWLYGPSCRRSRAVHDQALGRFWRPRTTILRSVPSSDDPLSKAPKGFSCHRACCTAALAWPSPRSVGGRRALLGGPVRAATGPFGPALSGAGAAHPRSKGKSMGVRAGARLVQPARVIHRSRSLLNRSKALSPKGGLRHDPPA